MDPNATLAIIADKTRSKTERNYACYDLQKWLDNGGFSSSWSDYPEAEYYYERWKDQGRHA